MAKTVKKVSVNQIILQMTSTLKTLNTSINSNKWEEAKLFFDLRSLPWHRTSYGSWTAFLDKDIDQHYQTVFIKIQAYKTATNLGYTLKELYSLSDVFSFSNLRQYFATLKKKVGVRTIKQKFTNKSIVRTFSKVPSVKSNMDNHFSFVLTQKNALKLVAFLSQYGLSVTPGGRKIGISDAADAWVDTL